MTFSEARVQPDVARASERASVDFPLDWILSKASLPVQYRAIRSVARIDDPTGAVQRLLFADFPSLRFAIAMGIDGTWNGRMLSTPDVQRPQHDGVGTIAAVHRLLEIGFEPDLPIFADARRILFRLLAEDTDPAFLFELASERGEIDRRRRARLTLREAAAGALAHLGYEHDPRLRGCADRMLRRTRDFLESPLAESPWISAGRQRLLAPDASPPSTSLVVMLSHMPRYRLEHHGFVSQLREYLSRPVRTGELLLQVGSALLPQPHLVLGNPCAPGGGADGDLASTLFWLEHLARMGYLTRENPWDAVFERLLSERDRDGVWRPPRGRLPAVPSAPEVWAGYPLDPRRDADAVAAEVTTRLGIIARAAGHEVVLV